MSIHDEGKSFEHVLAHENFSNQTKFLSSNFLYSLPGQHLQAEESVREMSCQINNVQGLHTPEIEKAWQNLSCFKVSSRTYAMPGITIPLVNGSNRESSQHVRTSNIQLSSDMTSRGLLNLQTPQNSHKISNNTDNPNSFMGCKASVFPSTVVNGSGQAWIHQDSQARVLHGSSGVQTSCTVRKQSVDAATNNIADDDILANIDLDHIIMEHSQSTCTPQPPSNLRPVMSTVGKSNSVRPEEYCLPPELCLICNHGCKLGYCSQGANHLQEMKDMLIAVSNELLDNLATLSPTEMEKLRQDRLLLNKKIQKLEMHLRTAPFDGGRQNSHFSASTATPIAFQHGTPYERCNEQPIPFPSMDKSGFSSVFAEREPYIPKITEINYIEGSNDKQWSCRDFSWTKMLEANNKKMFGNHSFRPNQREVINATMSGNDVFVLMPTGGGKSLTYQLPALICPGLTLVISPLVSLIQDQIMHLLQANIPAAYLSSNMEWTEQQDIFRDISSENCRFKMLYVTPEKIAKSDVLLRHLENLYARESLSRIVIDEAHCVSQWGHDFRPDYQALGILKQKFPNTPVLALTATATASVKEDVVQALSLVNCIVFRQSFNRPNLRFSVIPKTKKCVDDIHTFIKQHHDDECGIIYCLSRMDCEKVSERLQDYGHKVAFYHGSMDPAQRTFVQKQWSRDEINIICATVAFGMGINKPDVRFVIHHSIPKSIEGYHQECGRAGRDGQDSSCVLFYNYSDYIRIKLMISQSGTEQSPMSSRYSNSVMNSGRSFETNSENLLRMVSYCENDVDCRRFLQLLHLGEKFDSAMCGKTCDNCSKFKSSVEKDVTDTAKQLIELIRSAGQRFSSAHILEVYRGSESQIVKKHKHQLLSLHGKGKHIAKSEVSRVLRYLVIEEYLIEDAKKSDLYGSVSSILRVVESKVDNLFSGGKRIMLRIPSVGKALKFSGSQSVSANGLITPRQSQTQEKDACLSSKIFNALLRLRSHFSISEGVEDYHVFHKGKLLEISRKIPRTMEALLEIKGIADVKLYRYGERVLETIESTIKEHLKTDKNSSSGSSNESMKRRREGCIASNGDVAMDNIKSTDRSKKRPIKSQNREPGVRDVCLDDELDFDDDSVSGKTTGGWIRKAKPSGAGRRMLPEWFTPENKGDGVNDTFIEKYSFKG